MSGHRREKLILFALVALLILSLAAVVLFHLRNTEDHDAAERAYRGAALNAVLIPGSAPRLRWLSKARSSGTPVNSLLPIERAIRNERPRSEGA